MRNESEIYEQIDEASEKINNGECSSFMSYEDGVKNALEWVLKNTNEKPIENE